MPLIDVPPHPADQVSVPFDAGRGLMHFAAYNIKHACSSFSTLRCGSWIDALRTMIAEIPHRHVSVPFDAGRGLMRGHQRNNGLLPMAFQYPSMRVVD